MAPAGLSARLVTGAHFCTISAGAGASGATKYSCSYLYCGSRNREVVSSAPAAGSI